MFCFVLPSVFQVGDRLSLSPPVSPSWGPQLLHSGKSTPPCSPPSLPSSYVLPIHSLFFPSAPSPQLLCTSVRIHLPPIHSPHDSTLSWFALALRHVDQHLVTAAGPTDCICLAPLQPATRGGVRGGSQQVGGMLRGMHLPGCTALLCSALWFSYAGKRMLQSLWQSTMLTAARWGEFPMKACMCAVQ